MLLEICLAILTTALIALVLTLLKLFSQVQQSIQLLQADIHLLSKKTLYLLHTINEFVQADLHKFSEEASHLVGKLNDLSSDINNKSRSLNFLFQPLSFLSSKLGADSSLDESASNRKTLPQILKWVVSGALLFKTTREFIKSYGKRT